LLGCDVDAAIFGGFFSLSFYFRLLSSGMLLSFIWMNLGWCKGVIR
jgi:hypothetical protein